MLEPLKLSPDVLDGVDVDAGHRDHRAEPVERQDREGEHELPPDLRNAEGIGDRGDHALAAPPWLLGLDDRAGTARGLDRLTRLGAEGVRRHDQVLALELAAREDLHRRVLARGEAAARAASRA